MYRSAAALAALMITAAPTLAQAQDQPDGIDKVFGWVTPTSPGCAVAATHQGRLVVDRAYGLANVATRAPITGESVFDIGSLTKQFVAASILMLADEGRLALTDDVRKHIPELHDYGVTVTLDHLLTHTSGVRDWIGILPFAGDNPSALELLVRQRGLNFEPGTEWSYSNGGYVLLKEVVARVSGMPFDEFLERRVFEPLGMKSTSHAADITAVPNHVLAYEKQGGAWVPDMMLESARGGGAVFSTARDLAVWNEALTHNRLGEFVSRKLREPARLKSGRELDYARGIIVDAKPGSTILWHGGSAAAFKSVLVRFPEQDLGVAIVCNAGEAADARTMFASRIYDVLVPNAPAVSDAPAAAPAPGVALSADELRVRGGLYFNTRDGQPLRLGVNADRLGIQGGGPLLPLAANRFSRVNMSTEFMSGTPFEIQFRDADTFDMVTADGDTLRYTRAQPWTPTAAEMQALAGRFGNDELASVFSLTADGGALIMRVETMPDRQIRFTPVARDVFMFSRMVVRIVRDDAGKMIGFDYSNPAVRNLRFTRM